MHRLAVAFAVLASGCALIPPPPQRYSKAGASQTEFMSDRMACMEAARKPVSGASVNAYGGSSSATVMPSRGMYFTCMSARGYRFDPNGPLIVPTEAITTMAD